MIRRILLSISLSLAIMTSLSYSTDVSGDVWGEWTSAGNPYNVIGDLLVPPGSTLVIGPGCYVEFQGQFVILVDTTALFQVEGGETDSVTFTAADTMLGWGGLRFLSADSASFIKYSIIEYCGAGGSSGQGEIYCHNSHLAAENCLFQSSIASSGATIHIDRYCTYEIRSSLFSESLPFAIYVDYDSQGIIEENIITGYHGGFVLEIGGATQISRNIIYNNYDCCVILAESDPLLIEENIIHDNDGMILWFFHNGGESIISRNLIYNNYYDAPVGPGIIGCDDSEVRLINNTISNNAGNHQAYLAGFYEEFWAQPATLTNNIIWGNDYDPDHIFGIDSNVDFSISYSDIQGNWSGGWNIDADPMFVDTANGEFHLLPGSPCIDAGDPNSPFDPDSTIADMGALYFDQTTGINQPLVLPLHISLYQNYPNPFNASTNISFTIPAESNVSINDFDIMGRKVCLLLDRQLQAGEYSINWDGKSDDGEQLSSGIYFYNLITDDFEDSKKMVILK